MTSDTVIIIYGEVLFFFLCGSNLYRKWFQRGNSRNIKKLSDQWKKRITFEIFWTRMFQTHRLDLLSKWSLIYYCNFIPIMIIAMKITIIAVNIRIENAMHMCVSCKTLSHLGDFEKAYMSPMSATLSLYPHSIHLFLNVSPRSYRDHLRLLVYHNP